MPHRVLRAPSAVRFFAAIAVLALVVREEISACFKQPAPQWASNCALTQKPTRGGSGKGLTHTQCIAFWPQVSFRVAFLTSRLFATLCHIVASLHCFVELVLREAEVGRQTQIIGELFA